MSHAPPQNEAPERPSPAAEPSSAGWDGLRRRIVEALEEDPVNEAVLCRHLDRRDETMAEPAQHILAVLTGFCPAPAEARTHLEEALELRERWTVQRGRPVALRLALMDVLFRDNRRRPDPFLAELRLSPAPATGGVADPAAAPTSETALVNAVQGEVRRARRFNQEMALLRIHLDALETVRQRAGNAAVERTLREVALLVKNEIRDVDWAARTETQDLVVCLTGTGRFGAILVANRIAAKVRRVHDSPCSGSQCTRLSTGLASFPQDARFGWELLAMAENASHRARADGGDGVSDGGRPPVRRFLRVYPEIVRIMVRTLPEEDDWTPEGDGREGLIFVSPIAYDLGSRLEMDCIEIAGVGQVRLRGRVVRLEERPDGEYDVGVNCRLDGRDTALLNGQANRIYD
ncbi:MAG: GGDEF domain-containing protein [Acidobacteriota bacterium]